MQRLSIGLVLVLAVLLFSHGTSLAVPVAAGPPPSVTLSLQPASASAGDTVMLTWSSANAYGTDISPGIGWVAASGSLSITARETTTYTVTGVRVWWPRPSKRHSDRVCRTGSKPDHGCSSSCARGFDHACVEHGRHDSGVHRARRRSGCRARHGHGDSSSHHDISPDSRRAGGKHWG